MGLLKQTYEKTKENLQRIAFPKAVNEKMIQTAYGTGKEGYIVPILVGYADEIREALPSKGYEKDIFTIVDIGEEIYKRKLINRYVALPYTLLRNKALNRHMQDPLYYTMAMEAVGEEDVTLAGVDNAVGDVLLAGQMIIGLKPGISTVLSIGLCDIPGFKGSKENLLTISDSAVCANSDSGQLAGIAISACDTVRDLLGQEPRCAMVSYSTLEDEQGGLVGKVTEAVRITNEQRPEFATDGEFQFDAAISSAVTAKRVRRESRVTGKANMIIQLNLNVGNIGIKLIQQFGYTDAYDPMLQGFSKVVCNCSRGTPVSEIKGDIVISAVRAAGSKRQEELAWDSIKY